MAEVDELPLALSESVEQESSDASARGGGSPDKSEEAGYGYGGQLAPNEAPRNRTKSSRARSMQYGAAPPATGDARDPMGAASLGRGTEPKAARGGAMAGSGSKSDREALDSDGKPASPAMQSPPVDQPFRDARPDQAQTFSWSLDTGDKDQQQVRQLADSLSAGRPLLVQVTWGPTTENKSAPDSAPVVEGELLEQLTRRAAPLLGTEATKGLRFRLPRTAAGAGGGLTTHPEGNVLVVEGPQEMVREALQRLLVRSDIGARVVAAPQPEYYRARPPNELADDAAGFSGSELEKQLGPAGGSLLLLFQVTPPDAAPQQDDLPQPKGR